MKAQRPRGGRIINNGSLSAHTPRLHSAPSRRMRAAASPGRHAVAPGKSQTYSGEADNAEVRHYLARLGRRSRCFSRSIEALRCAVTLFVHAWNRRQLHARAFPRYACHVSDFVCH